MLWHHWLVIGWYSVPLIAKASVPDQMETDIQGRTVKSRFSQVHTHTHTHARLTALFPGLPRWASTRKVKTIWILLKQETMSGSGISWAICKSAPRSRQITMSAPHHSVFYRLVALPATQPTASKHWRQKVQPGNWCQMRDNWRYWILMLQSHWKGVTLSH